MPHRPFASAATVALLCFAVPAGGRAAPPQAPDTSVSAPIGNIRYELSFDSAAAASRTVRVAVTFDVAGPDPVLLSFRPGRQASTRS